MSKPSFVLEFSMDAVAAIKVTKATTDDGKVVRAQVFMRNTKAETLEEVGQAFTAAGTDLLDTADKFRT